MGTFGVGLSFSIIWPQAYRARNCSVVVGMRMLSLYSLLAVQDPSSQPAVPVATPPVSSPLS